ncbi:MAG TPA: MotA/TolQ/ExbB proton channel family protein [Armatimonadota bacterium]|nr:MotA/TolQ/ExbB proton channel family protein [Armatimonadota bacterium]
MTIQRLLQDPILLVLILASLASWIIIIDRCIVLLRVKQLDKAYQQNESSVEAPIALIRKVFIQYCNQERDDLLLIMDAAITQQRQHLEIPLPILGVIGSTAPFTGLLGTVFGIIQAFQSIQAHNNMSPAIISGGIASALIATAIGLAVAIPAVIAHHLFVSAINKRVAYWETVVATWLPERNAQEKSHGTQSLI